MNRQFGVWHSENVIVFDPLLTEWFRVKKGVRQGCVLSPYLFNILANMVMRETFDGLQGGLQIGGRMITNLRYADDSILLATDFNEDTTNESASMACSNIRL